MESVVRWQTLAVAVLAYYATLVFYRLFLDPLARFPGPRLAAISRWYEAYYDVFLGGRYTFKIAQLHKEYGRPHHPHQPVRTARVRSPFFETLYRLDGRWDKYAWTYDAFGAKDSTVFGSGHDAHKLHRRSIAPFFSKQNIWARQGLLNDNVEKLCRRISKLEGTTFNLGAAISAFTRDNANRFILGKGYNELELDDFGVGLSSASHGAGGFWRITKHIRWFGPLLKAMPISWAMKSADEGTRAFLRFMQQQEQDTRETLAAAMSPSATVSDKVWDTMVYGIAHSSLPPADKTLDRVMQEVGPTLGAGYETTANTLRLIFFHVYSDAEILRRIREELALVSAGGVSDSTDPVSLKQLEGLPYLTAVLTEGMRLSPGIATRAARITDKDLFYNQWRIPAGTPIGMTAYLMHIDETIYPEPMRFNPDRWLGSEGVAADSKFYAPFSRGTRMCLGMHFSWAQMYLILAVLVKEFDFTVKGTAEDFEAKMDNFAIGTDAGPNLLAFVTARSA
ncbi:cytochrome P450 [Apiospora saccharicola]|uniref:Cytochrome P450 n=1 Tax=Apiospora saccharicola TaxID=335842 RepID=A0ABR1WM12_9PEZI